MNSEVLEACVDAVIERIGKTIVLATPLGIGKPNQLLNAFFRRAGGDPDIRLTILTALSLERPRPKSDLQRRLMDPFVERHFPDYPELEYVEALRRDRLPANVTITEFYLTPGRFLDVPSAQRHYTSLNYTHVVREMNSRGVNVLAQMVAAKTGMPLLSLSSNPDVTLDLVPHLRESERQGRPVALIAQINNKLPFMPGDAVVPRDYFDLVLDDPALDFEPFAVPSRPLMLADHVIGLHTSVLLRDSGTLQLGIGSLADGIACATSLRQRHNDDYKEALGVLQIPQRYGHLIGSIGGMEPFVEGLYAPSELLSDGLLRLYQDRIVKRRVYGDLRIQRLLGQRGIDGNDIRQILEALVREGTIDTKLRPTDFDLLQEYGIVRRDVRYQDSYLYLSEGERIRADLADPESRKMIEQQFLGDRLGNGVALHSAFFLGSRRFYDALRSLQPQALQGISMTRVSKVNQVHDDWALAVLQRRDARFVNQAMKVTLSGAIVSDALEDSRVVSGVGGQYEFVSMAHTLPGARSIITLKSTRETPGHVGSNIVWNYGHITIPGHLRDIVITEYGIADLRGKSDEAVIAELLNITDSRFQGALLKQAKRAGKIAKRYQIPAAHRYNCPSYLKTRIGDLQKRGLFSAYPFGTDYTDEEQVLLGVLQGLDRKLATLSGRIRTVLRAMKGGPRPSAAAPYLERLRLDRPSGLYETALQRLVIAELAAQEKI